MNHEQEEDNSSAQRALCQSSGSLLLSLINLYGIKAERFVRVCCACLWAQRASSVVPQSHTSGTHSCTKLPIHISAFTGFTVL